VKSHERNIITHILCQKYISNVNIDLVEIYKSLAIFTSGHNERKGRVADSKGLISVFCSEQDITSLSRIETVISYNQILTVGETSIRNKCFIKRTFSRNTSFFASYIFDGFCRHYLPFVHSIVIALSSCSKYQLHSMIWSFWLFRYWLLVYMS